MINYSSLLPPFVHRPRLRLAALLCALSLCLPACGPVQNSSVDNFLHPPTKAPTSTLLPPQEVNLSSQLDQQGQALTPLVLKSPDGCMRLEIDQGVAVLDAAGQPAGRLEIRQDYPGKAPLEAFGVPISYAYRFGPDELHFSAPAKIVFSCLKNFKKSLLAEISLGIKGDGGEWEQLSVQGDAETAWTRLESVQPGRRYFLVGPAPMGS